MSKLIAQELINEKARIVDAPQAPTVVDRTFELPRSLYAGTVACYLGFLGVMAAGFASPGLIIPMAIFAFFIVAAFALPTIWATMQGNGAGRSKGGDEFHSRGIMTNTGMLKSGDVAAQVLVLPVLVLLWGLAVVTIAATI